jgi:hypothetical protein
MNNEAGGTVTETPTPSKFEEWLRVAGPGEVYVYAVSHVLDGRTPPETLAVALLARQRFADSHIELTQKRTNGPGSPLEYRATSKHIVSTEMRFRASQGSVVPGLKWRDNFLAEKRKIAERASKVADRVEPGGAERIRKLAADPRFREAKRSGQAFIIVGAKRPKA